MIFLGKKKRSMRVATVWKSRKQLKFKVRPRTMRNIAHRSWEKGRNWSQRNGSTTFPFKSAQIDRQNVSSPTTFMAKTWKMIIGQLFEQNGHFVPFVIGTVNVRKLSTNFFRKMTKIRSRISKWHNQWTLSDNHRIHSTRQSPSEMTESVRRRSFMANESSVWVGHIRMSRSQWVGGMGIHALTSPEPHPVMQMAVPIGQPRGLHNPAVASLPVPNKSKYDQTLFNAFIIARRRIIDGLPNSP